MGLVEGASAVGMVEGASAAGLAEGASAVGLVEGASAAGLGVGASAVGLAEAPPAATLLLLEVTDAEGLVRGMFLRFFSSLSASAKLPEVTVAAALGLVKLLARDLLLAL